MRNINKQFIIFLFGIIALVSVGCEKLALQKPFKYKPSLYNNQLGMSAMDFMLSRQDLFSGMLRAINYVDQYPEYQYIKKLYSESSGNTFLLMTDDALVSRSLTGSWFSVNKKLDTDPESLTFGRMAPAYSWEQYPKDSVANLLTYHILKGTYDYKTLNSTPKWVDTYALSSKNDSAKVNIYLSADREGQLYLNNYSSSTKKNIRPRTPDLHATNGVVQVLDTYLIQPRRTDLN